MKGYLFLFVWIFMVRSPVTGQIFQEDMEVATQEEAAIPNPGADSAYYALLADPHYGLNLYENLNYLLGGDSSRMDKRGYAARGWMEDHYPGGGLLHKGYYVDGHLKIYKNYYPDGTVERSFRTLDNYRSSMELFYKDGTLKSKVLYQEGMPLKWEDYYPTGKLEYCEEFNKSLDYYVEKKSFHANGTLNEILLLIKESKHLYENKVFSESGVLVEEGKIEFNQDEFDYRKIGKWSLYDSGGKLVKEQFYVDGKLDREKSL